MTRAAGRARLAVSVAVLAVLAYVPVLASSPGRMPADTKLFLYLDPGGLLGRAASTFEPDQFAGWVPFQQITYLWPSGPWYALLDAVGVPDWVAHRLWVGTILFLAGTGVLWAARRVGLSPAGALVAALVYQLSPYLLPYVSRTSLLLLPWAAVGWIVGLTVRATLVDRSPATSGPPGWRDRLVPWREPALIALVVATVGSANATTLMMIVPAPVLWIVHVAWQRRITWVRAVGVTARIGVLCLGVSIWWMAMLFVQSRHGAPVLAYTETLTDVSRNATGSEVLRGLGYWLFYQRGPIAPTTTASFDYLNSVRMIAVGYAVVLAGLVGLLVTRWAQRRYAALCVAAGLVLAVGVHPIDSPSPLVRLLVGGEESGLALALRSSTRAVPVMLLGVALGAGALVTALQLRAVERAAGSATAPSRLVPTVVAVVVVALAVLNLPSLWQRSFVDPAIDRDQDPPAAWAAAVDRLAATDAHARIVQLPGSEFGSFRWGHTVDHPLVGLTDEPVVTRDLLPLGSAGAMDLLFALDDRVQDGVLEPEAVPAVARLLGADTIWVSGDAAFERFRTARPEIVDDELTSGDITGLGPAERFGDAVVNVPEVEVIEPVTVVDPRVGRPISPVTLIPVQDPVPVVRAKTASVVLSGSGDGIIDAATAGIVSGFDLIRYSGSLAGAELTGAVETASVAVVTDTNRDEARHWRGSQDTRGHTEPGGPGIDVLTPTAADQRLAVQPDDAARQTVAVQEGPVRAVASSYGEPFAYRPEDRAVMAVDGDPATAWRVGDHGDPLGERLRLELVDGADGAAPSSSVRLLQAPERRGDRSIASVRITVDDGPSVEVGLDPATRTDGQVVELPAVPTSSLTIEITGITPGDVPLASSLAGVGFAEVDLGLGPTVEFIRPPVDALPAIGETGTPLAMVLTRLRVDATDPWRSDPEPVMRRRVEVPDRRSLDGVATVRLDRRATDAVIADLLAAAASGPVPTASARVTGGVAQRGAASVDGDPATAWVTPFDDAVGSMLEIPAAGPLGAELVVEQPAGPFSPVTAVRLARGSSTAELVLTDTGAGRAVAAIPPEFATASGPLTLTITAVAPRTTIDRRYGDPRTLPAAIGELTATEGVEIVTVDPATPVTAECTGGLLELDGRPVPLSFRTTAGALLAGEPVTATTCAPVVLTAGAHDLVASGDDAPGLTVDRVVLVEPTVPPAAGPESLVTTETIRREPRHREVTVAPCPDGCWLVLGEGFNDAWSATADGTSLGAPQLVDGGFNGWWLTARDESTTVTFRWTAQTPVTVGLAISGLTAVLCGAVALLARRRPPPPVDPPRLVGRRLPVRASSAWWAGGALVVASGLFIGPAWAVVALVPAAVLVAVGRRIPTGRVLEATGVLAAAFVAVAVMWITRRDRPFPDAGWTLAYDHLHGLAVFAVLAVAAGAAFAPDADGVIDAAEDSGSDG